MNCFECDQKAVYEHHVVPRIRGGTKTVWLCDPCHAKAHHRKKNMNTSKLTKEALDRKRAKGERISGTIPFGKALASDGVHLVDHPEE